MASHSYNATYYVKKATYRNFIAAGCFFVYFRIVSRWIVKRGGIYMETIVKVRNLKKYFREVKAVDDISFSVEQGELFGFLGVNGAGKSTTINMMCTLFAPTDGEIEICGEQVGKGDALIREQIGVVWQNNCLDERLTVKENLYVRASLYGKKGASLKSEIDRVCEKLQLGDIYGRRYGKLSGGQKRRCEIAAALVNTPKILFLDEPTTGLDPATRKLVWESIDRLRAEDGMTVFLTTHYMEEAAKANHVAVIDSGKMKEFGTPFELKERYTTDSLMLYPKEGCRESLENMLEEYLGMEKKLRCETVQDAYRIRMPGSIDAIPILKEAERLLQGFEMLQGTMDDVFLNITGKSLE